jgi:hypothetical protein
MICLSWHFFRYYYILDTDNTHISNTGNEFDNILVLANACFWNIQIFACQTYHIFFKFMCHHAQYWNLKHSNYITIPSLKEAYSCHIIPLTRNLSLELLPISTDMKHNCCPYINRTSVPHHSTLPSLSNTVWAQPLITKVFLNPFQTHNSPQKGGQSTVSHLIINTFSGNESHVIPELWWPKTVGVCSHHIT